MRRRLSGLTVALLLATGCAYHAGTKASRDWDAWVEDHPIRGAVATTAAGNASPFRGTLDVYAKLVVPGSSSAIVHAMSDMCGFEKVRSTPTTYWLTIDTRITIQGLCEAKKQARLSAFYASVKALDGVTRMTFSTGGLDAQVSDSAIPRFGPALAAADATGVVSAGAPYVVHGQLVTASTTRGTGLTAELGVTGDAHAVVGSHARSAVVAPGLVLVETDGDPASARGWQQSVTVPGSVALTVVPDKVTTTVSLSGDPRSLVETLATDQRVIAVDAYDGHWSLTVTGPAVAPAVIKEVGEDAGRSGLGKLVLVAGAPGDGVGCYVRPTYAGAGTTRAAALLGLCARGDVPQVDDRVDPLGLRLSSDDLTSVLTALHGLADGSGVYLRVEGPTYSGTYSFTLGDSLAFDQPSDTARALERIWASLEPHP